MVCYLTLATLIQNLEDLWNSGNSLSQVQVSLLVFWRFSSLLLNFCGSSVMSRDPMSNDSGKAVFNFVYKSITAMGRPPTYREIGKACYLCHVQVGRWIKRLADSGYLTKNGRHWRGIALVEGVIPPIE